MQQHVAGRVQAVGAGLVIADAHGAASRIALAQVAQRAFQVPFALAQHRHLQLRMRVQRLRQGLRGHVGHFLAGEPAAHDQQHRLGILAQTVFVLRGGLAQPLVGQVGRAVAQRSQVRIARRVPQLGVDAVGNGQQIGHALAQDAVESAAELRGQDFTSVALADGGDAVGIADSGLHEIQLAPGLCAILAAEGGGNAERGRILDRRLALEGEVVDGQHTLDVFHPRGPQQQGDQGGMPVVGVHQVGARQPGQPLGDAHRRVRQGRVAQGIVAVGLAAVVEVEAFAVIERVVLQQQERQPRLGTFPGQQLGVAARQAGQPGHRPRRPQPLRDATIGRQQQRRPGLRLGQRAGHAGDGVAQAPGLCQGECFCRHDEDTCCRHARSGVGGWSREPGPYPQDLPLRKRHAWRRHGGGPRKGGHARVVVAARL